MNSYETKNIGNHKVEIFRAYDGTSIYISDAQGAEIFKGKVSGNPVERAKEIIAQTVGAKYDKGLMKQAVAQTLAGFIALADGETDGSTKLAAVLKAADVIDRNNSIEFDGVKLSFVSDESNEPRIVTQHGCSQACPCGNRISYHRALFAIFERYQALQTETTVRAFQPRCKGVNGYKCKGKVYDLGLCADCYNFMESQMEEMAAA